MQTRICAALWALVLVLTCGCQKTPEKRVVTGKNDGIFENALEKTPQEAPTGAQEWAVHQDSFENANGAIRYELSLTAPDMPTALPVVRVRPMEITPELAQKAAQAVFGDAEIYEYTTEHTKSELEAAILQLKERVSDFDALVESCGGDEAAARDYKAALEGRISEMEAAYAAAPDTAERKPCDWQFRPGSYYSDVTRGQIADIGQQVLKAGVTVDGAPFVLEAVNLEKDGYRQHTLDLGPDADLADLDALYADTGARPDPAAIRTKAVQIADGLSIGDWRVAVCDSDPNAPTVTYLTLTRTYEGLPMTDHDGPNETDSAYGPVYTYEKLRMDFNGDKLLSLLYQGALEQTAVVNANVQTLPFADILDAAKTQMRLRGTRDPVTGEQVPAPADGGYDKIAVERVELGLSRVLIQDDTTEYYLVPTYTFYGTAASYNADGTPVDHSFFDGETGQTITLPNETTVELAVINAVDGSAIDPALGY